MTKWMCNLTYHVTLRKIHVIINGWLRKSFESIKTSERKMNKYKIRLKMPIKIDWNIAFVRNLL